MEHKTTPAHAPLLDSAKGSATSFSPPWAFWCCSMYLFTRMILILGWISSPGSGRFSGVVGAVILAKGAKGLAHTVLGKDEDYYEEHEKGSWVQSSGEPTDQYRTASA